MKKYVIILKNKQDPSNRFDDELLEVSGWKIDDYTFIYHDTLWYVIDIKSGAMIVWGHTKKEAIEKFSNEELQKKLHEYRFTGSYEQQVLRFRIALERELKWEYERQLNDNI